jgi:signal peptidase I
MMRRREAIGLAGTVLLGLSAGRAAAATFGEWFDGANIAARFVAAGIPAKSYAMGSSSMMPTLGEADVLLADLRAAGTVPGRGEIIVFRPPGPDTVYAKRVIGLPGDRIALKAGRLVLNGKVVERRPKGQVELDLPFGPTPVSIYEETLSGVRPYEIAETSDAGMLDDVPERVVPPDAVFVLGDNRDNSMDSRVAEMGSIPIGAIFGRVVYRLRPASGWLVPPKSVPGLD